MTVSKATREVVREAMQRGRCCRASSVPVSSIAPFVESRMEQGRANSLAICPLWRHPRRFNSQGKALSRIESYSVKCNDRTMKSKIA